MVWIVTSRLISQQTTYLLVLSLLQRREATKFVLPAMDKVNKFCEPGRVFAKDSIRLVKGCTMPNRKEFQKIAIATAMGFCIMGFICIPINNIIVTS